MHTVFRISGAVSHALHGIVYLVAHAEGPVTIAEIASALNVSENSLSKVFQRLAKAGYLKSVRGPEGGFVLGRSPDKISLLDIYEAIEGHFTESTCLLSAPVCGRKNCIFGGLLKKIDHEVGEYLSKKKLSGLVYLFKKRKDVRGVAFKKP